MKNVAAALTLGLMALPAFGQAQALPSLTYYGRASVKIKTASGLVIYIDPYQGDYSEPADLVLVTHGHSDHNAVDKVAMKKDCAVVAPKGAASAKFAARPIAEGQELEVAGVTVAAVPANNKNHARGSSVGYVLVFDGLTLYHSGDTNKLPEMAALASRKIDWVLFCTDGFYNMGAAEAAECAALVVAKRSIPIHSSPNGLHDPKTAEAYAKAAPGGLVVPVGGVVALKP